MMGGMEEIEKWLEGQSQLFLILGAIILFSLGISIGCLIQSSWSMILAALLHDKNKKHTVMSYLHHASLDILQPSNSNTNKSNEKRSTDLTKVDAKKVTTATATLSSLTLPPSSPNTSLQFYFSYRNISLSLWMVIVALGAKFIMILSRLGLQHRCVLMQQID